MRLLTLGQLRFLGRSPFSTAAVVVGIMLGVASVVAVHLLSLRVSVSLEALTAAHLNELTHIADRPGLGADDYFALRQRWRAGELEGVKSLLPMVEGPLVLKGKTVRVIGLDPFAGPRAALALAALPARSVLVSSRFARDLGLPEARWSETDLAVPLPEPLTAWRVAGVYQNDERTLLTDIGTAQTLLNVGPERLSAVGLRVEHRWRWLGERLDRAMPGIGAGFAAPTVTLDGFRVRPIDAELPSRAFAESVLFNIGALGSLALVVSWLLVYQVAVIWLRRRRRTMQMLKLQGVTPGELARGFLSSLLLLAVLATLLGLLLGWLLAELLTSVSTAGLDAEELEVSVDGWLLAKALGSGLGVTLLGAMFALRGELAVERPARRWPLIFVLLLGAAGFGAVGVSSLWGAFLSIVAVAMAALLTVGPLLELGRWLAQRRRSRAGLLPFKPALLSRAGLRELVFYPRELAVAVGALALAVATSLALSLMVDSFRRDFAAMLEVRLAHDVFVRGDGRDLSGLAQRLADAPLVDAVSAYGQARVRVEGLAAELSYSRFDEFEARRYGLRAPLRAFEAVASERLLRELTLQPGERLRLNDGERPLTVVASIPGFGEPLPRLIVTRATAEQLLGQLLVDRVSLRTTEAAALAEQLAREEPELEVIQAPALRALALDIFDRTFAITNALTLLALLVAGVGLYNAVTALKLTTQRARALLAAMGASAREARRLELMRGAAVAAAVLLVAVPLGLLMSAMLCELVNPRAFGWRIELAVRPAALLPPVLTGVGVVLLTSLLPVPTERLGENLEGSIGGTA